MKLEQFYVFPIVSVLDAKKRKLIETGIAENPELYGRKVEHKWLKRGDEKFLRILIDPVTIEIVFFPDRIECYGAAPAWARLLFTKSEKAKLKNRIEEALILAGFVDPAPATSGG